MASQNLSQLTAATTSSGSDLYYLVQGGLDKSITFTNLQSAIIAGSPASVSSLNSLTGALNIVAGTNISVTPSGSSITIASTGGGGGGVNTNLDNLTPTSINQTLLPNATQTFNLGSDSLQWGEGHIAFLEDVQTVNATSGVLSLSIGGSTVVAISTGLVRPFATLDMGTHSIINVLDPINPQDGATKNYVDTSIATIGAPVVTYTPATLGDWAGSPPTTVQQALDRIAAVVGGVTPIP